MEAGNPLLDDYVLGLAAATTPATGRRCAPPDRVGDADHYVVRFYRHFSAAGRCEPSHVSLFGATAAPTTCARTCSSRTWSTSGAAASSA